MVRKKRQNPYECLSSFEKTQWVRAPNAHEKSRNMWYDVGMHHNLLWCLYKRPNRDDPKNIGLQFDPWIGRGTEARS